MFFIKPWSNIRTSLAKTNSRWIPWLDPIDSKSSSRYITFANGAVCRGAVVQLTSFMDYGRNVQSVMAMTIYLN